MSQNGNGNGSNGMSGDELKGLSNLYQQTRTVEPPEHVDAAILALAKQQVKKHPASPFSARWPISASMVAVLVLAFGLVTFMQWELGPENVVTDTMAPQLNGSGKLEEAITEDAAPKVTRPAEKEKLEKAVPSAPVRRKKKVENRLEQRKDTLALVKPEAKAGKKTAPQSEASSPQLSMEQPSMKQPSPEQPSTKQPLFQQRQSQQPASEQEKSMAMDEAGAALPKQSIMSAPTGMALRKPMPSSATVCQAELPPISAREYWREYVKGKSRLVEQDSGMACVVINEPDHPEHRHIAMAALQDREVKQQVFITALDETMTALSANKLSATQQQSYLNTLQRLTGLTLDTPAQWHDWYQTNKNTLTLSEDGRHVISHEKTRRQ